MAPFPRYWHQCVVPRQSPFRVRSVRSLHCYIFTNFRDGALFGPEVTLKVYSRRSSSQSFFFFLGRQVLKFDQPRSHCTHECVYSERNAAMPCTLGRIYRLSSEDKYVFLLLRGGYLRHNIIYLFFQLWRLAISMILATSGIIPG